MKYWGQHQALSCINVDLEWYRDFPFEVLITPQASFSNFDHLYLYSKQGMGQINLNALKWSSNFLFLVIYHEYITNYYFYCRSGHRISPQTLQLSLTASLCSDCLNRRDNQIRNFKFYQEFDYNLSAYRSLYSPTLVVVKVGLSLSLRNDLSTL